MWSIIYFQSLTSKCKMLQSESLSLPRMIPMIMDTLHIDPPAYPDETIATNWRVIDVSLIWRSPPKQNETKLEHPVLRASAVQLHAEVVAWATAFVFWAQQKSLWQWVAESGFAPCLTWSVQIDIYMGASSSISKGRRAWIRPVLKPACPLSLDGKSASAPWKHTRLHK